MRPKVEAFKLDAKSHIIKYLIKQDQPSTVLTPYQLSNLAERMQGIYRRSQWKLLYRMSQNGTSMITF